jgi:hypothetical protein
MTIYYFMDYIQLEKDVKTNIQIPESGFDIVDIEAYAKPVINNVGYNVFVSDITNNSFNIISNFSGLVKWVLIGKKIYNEDYYEELMYKCHQEKYNLV